MSDGEVATTEVASVGRRVGGQVINGLVPFAIAVMFTTTNPDAGAYLVLALLLGPGYLALEVVLLHRVGGHLGHLVLGMRATTADAGPPSWSQAAIRVAVFVLFPLYLVELVYVGPITRTISLAWTIVLLVSIMRDPNRRGLHDKAAGTTVVLLPKR